ncbi:MAG: MBL fold metallo-hydrolase [Pseudomonadales bacterium]|nr:MBL fold metallo-hydrolase [Pseudomonadales bacterium]
MKKILPVLPLLAATLLPSSLVAHQAPAVQETLPLDGLMTAFGWDLSNATINTEKVGDNLHVLFGLGGNIAVSTGKDGVLIVDDQFPQLIPQIKSAIDEINVDAKGDNEVDFAINTHWHFDHAEGNLALGPQGTWIVAHENSREMMKQDHVINLVVASYNQKAYPEDAWPNITYDDDMSFHLNGETVDLFHFGPAHTTGDTAIVFRGTNAVHLGDVFNNAGYPFIDAGNGGTLDGVIHFCSETLKVIDRQTTVIPGHGPLSNYEGLQDYIEMLTTIRASMINLINAGASLDDVYNANVTQQWDEKMGDNTGFINRSYMSLTHKVVDK